MAHNGSAPQPDRAVQSQEIGARTAIPQFTRGLDQVSQTMVLILGWELGRCFLNHGRRQATAFFMTCSA